jgi:transcription initiation factor IIE alpha subunit
MEKISCPVCGEDMSEHDDLQTHKCLQKFIKVATNPVVYASVKKTICPTCKKDMTEHNQDQTVECLNKFIKQVSGKSD